jgi:hypothetical protein
MGKECSARTDQVSLDGNKNWKAFEMHVPLCDEYPIAVIKNQSADKIGPFSNNIACIKSTKLK